jgi:hypothetical protein
MKQFSMTSLQLAVLAALLGFATAAIDPALCKLDMVLCLDNSGSIAVNDDGSEDLNRPPANWKLVIDFCQDIVNQLTVSPTDSQVGLVDFDDEVRIQFGLNKYPTKPEVVDNIGLVEFRGYRTNTTGGLFKSRTVLTNDQYGPRDGKSKVVVLITDGVPTVDADTVLAEAQNCRDDGVRVIVVGITQSVDEALLKQIAYSPNDYVYAADFKDLESIKNVVLNDESCKPLPTIPPAKATAAPTTKPPVTEPPEVFC